MANSPYITPAQVDEKVQAAFSRGISASAKGFELFTNEAAKDAFFTATPPIDDTPFIYTDDGESKDEFFQRASDNTTQVLREAGLTENNTTNDIDTDGVANTKAVRDAFEKIKVYNGNQIFDKGNDIKYIDYIISSGGALATSGTSTGGKVVEIEIDSSKKNITINGIVGIGTSGSFRGRFIDKSGILIGTSFLLTNPVTREIPGMASKVQFTIQNPSQAPAPIDQFDAVMVNYGVVAQSYEDFAGSTQKIVKAFGADIVGSVNALTGNQKIYKGNQIFDKDTMLVPNYRITSGLLQNVSNYVMAQIPLYEFEGQPISVSGLIGSGTTGTKYFRFINTEGAKLYDGYFRYNYDKLVPPKEAFILQFTIKAPSDTADYADAVMVNYGFNALPFEAYSEPDAFTINEKIDGKENYPQKLQSKGTRFLKPYYNETLVIEGDSIVQQLSFAPLVAAGIGANFDRNSVLIGSDANGVPMGVGGSTIKPIITGAGGQDAGESIYYRADFIKDFDPGIILLEGGQNDGRDTSYNIWDPIYTGPEVNAGDPSAPSFVSSMKGYLFKAITQNKNAKIAFISPMYTGSTPLTQAVYESYQLRNDTMRSVCRIMGVQFIDLLNNSGLNPFNNDTLLKDGIHPTGRAGEIITKYIISQL